MNKKIVALVLALVLCLTSVAALAASSKTTNNVVTTKPVDQTTPTVAVVSPTEASKTTLDELAAFVNGGNDVISFFDADIQSEIAAQAPGAKLKVDEVFPVTLTAATSGKVSVKLSTAATYSADAKVVVMGRVNGKWVVLKTRIENGKLVVDLPADLVAEMSNGADAVLTVLSDVQ